MRKIFLQSTIVLLLDIISKQIIIHTLVPNETITLIKNFLNLTYTKNTGIAFSFLEGHIPFIIMMTLVVIFIILKQLHDIKHTPLEVICYGLIIGGALGNLLDRIFYGYVIDFIELILGTYHFPIFNLADTFIVIGIFILIIGNLKETTQNKKEEHYDHHNRNK